ncbi:MAG TPA: prenyltransferase/squalene oxidase repeat-containing protein [Acidobacteriaceae bacterium]
MKPISRRGMLQWSLIAAAGLPLHSHAFAGETSPTADIDGQKIKDTTFQFIAKCARNDGGYSPSPDSNYKGSSDTAESDLAAVTYAATLSKPEGRTLAHAKKSADFIQHRQQPDGVFINLAGNLDPKSDLAILYNTVQGVVGLRALGAMPQVNPVHVMDRFFQNNAFAKLPWYTVSFFPLFYAALGVPFPLAFRTALEHHLLENQAADGYLGDHVAATFHLVHFYRLIGQPTPKGDAIVQRVLRDQRPDGGWHLKPPDWDVHSCFDAVFILRQLGGNSPACRAAIAKAARWSLGCQNPDGGFGHYPGYPSDMDAVYFQLGTLIQAGLIPGTNFHLPDAETLSWGHVMQPGIIYKTA